MTVQSVKTDHGFLKKKHLFTLVQCEEKCKAVKSTPVSLLYLNSHQVKNVLTTGLSAKVFTLQKALPKFYQSVISLHPTRAPLQSMALLLLVAGHHTVLT